MKSKRIKIASIILLLVLGGALIVFLNINNWGKDTGRQKVSLSELKELIESEEEEIRSGKYANLNVISLDYTLPEIVELRQINVSLNNEYKNNTHSQNIANVTQAIDKFFHGSFPMEEVVAYVFDKDGSESDEIPFPELESKLGEINVDNLDKYFLFFGDARENGGKGFLQIDSSFRQTWFSRGEAEATSPLYSYEAKKAYNLTLSKDNLEEVVQLKNGQISIADAVKFVEDYLNTDLPFEKNADFTYEVAEVRILNVDGQDGLGFLARRRYADVPFDYGDGETIGDYVSEFYDDRASLCMMKTDEIDNMVSVGNARNFVEKAEEPLEKIYSLDSAFAIVSENIGESSVYDVYGAELVYQFREEKDEDGETIYTGRLNWKILSKNQTDDKDTWFYVDVEDGTVSHRFKQIRGES